MNAILLRGAGDPMWIDMVSALLWLVTAILSVYVVRAHLRGARASWILVSGFCTVVVVDKAVDLQMVALDFAKAVRDALLASPELQEQLAIDFREHGIEVKATVLVAATILGLTVAIWLARRDRGMDRNRVLALLGVLGVIGYVGLRMVPGLAERLSGIAGWGIEFACWLCVTLGLVRGLRAARTG